MKEVISNIDKPNLLDNIPFGFVRVNLSGEIVYANPSACSLLKLTQTELLGKRYDELPWQQYNEDLTLLRQQDHTIYQALNEKVEKSVNRMLVIEGQERWLSISSSPYYVEGNLVGAISNFVDITEKKSIEHELQQDADRQKALIENIDAVIWESERDSPTFSYVSPKAEEIFGYPHSSWFQPNFWQDKVHPDDLDRVITFEKNQTNDFQLEYRLRAQSGDYRWVSYHVKIMFDGGKTLLRGVILDITKNKEAEQNTENEEKLKRGILDALGDGILVVDSNGLVLNINKSLQNYLRRESILQIGIGKSVFDFIDELDRSKFLRAALHALLTRESNFFEHQMKLKDGKWYSLRATQLVDRFGAVISFQNINTRKEIELALEKSLRKYRNIYNKAPVMMHSIDRELRIISVSDFWLEKMGYDRNEVIGRSPVDFLEEESKLEIVENLRDLIKVGEIKNRQYQYVKKSGEVIDVLLSAVAEYDESGRFERSITGMIDISEQKAAERELQESGARLLEAQKISKLGNYELDLKSMEIVPSNEMALMVGVEAKPQSVKQILELAHPDDLAELKELLESAIDHNDDLFYIYRIFHGKTNKQRWISKRGKVINDEDGKPLKLIGTVQDITEQRTAEDKIKRLSDRILLATEIANLGVWEYDRVTEEIFWEDQMYNIFTNTSEPFRAAEFVNYLNDQNGKILEECLAHIKKGVNFLENEFQVNISGEIKYLRSFTRILRNDSGSMRGMIGVVYDITADKKLQEDLKFSLDEKNILIKEVHHRVKNNMQLISSIMALRAYDLEDEKSKDIFEDINTRIKAMALIHDKLYKFYNVSEIDIKEYLFHISQELKVLLGIKFIDMNVESDNFIMNVDQALLVGLIVSELVSNAVKHSYQQKKEGDIDILFKRSGEINSLAVLNDGEPIPSDCLNANTGLGMSLIKTFAKQLRGNFSLDSRNGF